MIKWRMVAFFLIVLVLLYQLRPKELRKQKLRAHMRYFVRVLVVALVLYWLLVIL
jgi:hypothetical protein